MDLVLDRKRVEQGNIKTTASLLADYLPRETISQLTNPTVRVRTKGKLISLSLKPPNHFRATPHWSIFNSSFSSFVICCLQG